MTGRCQAALVALALLASCEQDRAPAPAPAADPPAPVPTAATDPAAVADRPAAPSPAAPPATVPTGTYAMVDDTSGTACDLTVESIAPTALSFALSCSTESAHVGEADGVASRSDAGAPYVLQLDELPDEEPCRFELTPEPAGGPDAPATITVRQRGTVACDFGAGVDATGRYTRR